MHIELSEKQVTSLLRVYDCVAFSETQGHRPMPGNPRQSWNRDSTPWIPDFSGF